MLCASAGWTCALGAAPTRVTRESDGDDRRRPPGRRTPRRRRAARGDRPQAARLDLGLDTVGLARRRAPSRRRADARRGDDWLYAVGDVNGRTLLTHMGKHQARVAADNVLGARRRLHRRPTGALARASCSPSRRSPRSGTRSTRPARPAWTCASSTTPSAPSPAAASTARAPRASCASSMDEDRKILVGATFTGSTSRSSSTPRRSPSSARCRSTACTPVPSFPTRSEVWLRLLEKYGL